MNKRSAYTLIELIVVIALLGIILVMTMPNSKLFNTLNQALELKEFKRDMLFARNKAIIDSRRYVISFIYEENGYIIEKDSQKLKVKTKYFTKGLKLNKRNDLKSITFNANGTITNSGTIYFYDRNDQEYKMTIPPVRGLIEIEAIDQ